jgi:chromosome segregation ATPase
MTSDHDTHPDEAGTLDRARAIARREHDRAERLDADVRRLTADRDTFERALNAEQAEHQQARDDVRRLTTERDQVERERDDARAALREIRDNPRDLAAPGLRTVARRALGDDLPAGRSPHTS